MSLPKIMTPSIKNNLDALINPLGIWVAGALNRFRARRDGYGWITLRNDLSIIPAVQAINTFFQFQDVALLESIFLDILTSVLVGNIARFDDTKISPGFQLAGKINFKTQNLIDIDISNEDEYSKAGMDNVFERFIKRVESIQKEYTNTHSSLHLKQLILLLLRQFLSFQGAIDKINRLLFVYFGSDDAIIRALRDTFTNYQIQVQTPLDQSLMTDQVRENENIQMGDKPGSLVYLLIKSHNLSRTKLYENPKVKESLEKALK